MILNVGTHVFDPTLVIPLPVDNDSDFPPPHKILEKLALLSTKVASAHHSIPELKGKGKQNLIDAPAISQSGKGKHKAASPLRPANGKKQHGGHMVGVANYSVEDLDALFDILEECLPPGGHAWNYITYKTQNMFNPATTHQF